MMVLGNACTQDDDDNEVIIDGGQANISGSGSLIDDNKDEGARRLFSSKTELILMQ